MELPADLLDRAPEEGARLLALSFLAQAEGAVPRLHDARDEEALHDFRVGLRRLRTIVRVLRAALDGSVARKQRDRLRELARSTNAGRDAEVQLAWLEGEGAHFRGRQRTGYTWLRTLLTARRDDSYGRARREMGPAVEKLAKKLRGSLSEYALPMRVGEPARGAKFASLLATVVRELADELEARLGAVHSLADQEQAHEARISAKRLRYVLDPLGEQIEGVKPLVKRLKELQDVLGEMHDMHVLAVEVASAVEAAAAGRARRLHQVALKADPGGRRMRAELRHDERPGLLEIARRVHSHESGLFLELANGWLADHAAAFFADVRGVAEALDARGRSDTEVERKYLLTGAPSTLARVEPIVISQGWIPGTSLHERLRRTRRGKIERYFRAVKLGRGVRRIEVEEETTRAVFARLWPLTAGKRVEKKRYVVEEDGLRWEIDVFSDRDLVLCEVELPSEDVVPTPPPWLAALLVREVTDDPTYLNLHLAK